MVGRRLEPGRATCGLEPGAALPADGDAVAPTTDVVSGEGVGEAAVGVVTNAGRDAAREGATDPFPLP